MDSEKKMKKGWVGLVGLVLWLILLSSCWICTNSPEDELSGVSDQCSRGTY